MYPVRGSLTLFYPRKTRDTPPPHLQQPAACKKISLTFSKTLLDTVELTSEYADENREIKTLISTMTVTTFQK
jgi:hypothetical protein